MFRSIRYHKSWIPSRFCDVGDLQYSFVHINVDINQPTKDSLEFFYPRLSPGGILLSDDYGYHTRTGARTAFDDLAATTPEKTVMRLPTGQGFLVKRWPCD